MEVFGLIGNPVGHSLSPVMHEAAYDELGLEARYCAFEPARDELATAVAGADALGVRGLNVTIPFKQDVLSLVEPDHLASRIGAVNTIDFGGVGGDGGIGGAGGVGGDGADGSGGSRVPTGHNTDAAGAVRAFDAHDVDLSGTAVVVGAGGAGRAVAFGLAAEGMTVRVANRTVEKAERLAADVDDGTSNARTASGHGLDELAGVLADASVLVNCTSVGMESDETPVPREALHADLAVLDAVYAPIETRLLREASAVGATTIDGAWMLLFQGIAAFERWTGLDAPVDAMNDALRATL